MKSGLHEHLQGLQAQIQTEKQKGSEQNKFLVAQLEEQEASILEQIMHEEVESNHEERMQQAQEKITYLLDSLEVDGISIRNLSISDAAYELQRAGVEQAVKKLVEPLNVEIKGFEEREQQLQRQNDRLQEMVRQHDITIQTLSKELNQAKFELEDSNQKRDAAVRATDQADELLRLKQEELDLERAEKALGAREAYKVVDTSEQIKQLAENFRKSQIRVTGIRWEDEIKKTFKLAELADTGETIRFHYFEQGKYLELNQEEALQFRFEYNQAKILPDLPLDNVEPPALQVEEKQFQVPGPEMVVPTPGESQAEVSRQEFEALKVEVEALKRKVGWAA